MSEFKDIATEAVLMGNIHAQTKVELENAYDAALTEQMEMHCRAVCEICNGDEGSLNISAVLTDDDSKWIHISVRGGAYLDCQASDIREANKWHTLR